MSYFHLFWHLFFVFRLRFCSMNSKTSGMTRTSHRNCWARSLCLSFQVYIINFGSIYNIYTLFCNEFTVMHALYCTCVYIQNRVLYWFYVCFQALPSGWETSSVLWPVRRSINWKKRWFASPNSVRTTRNSNKVIKTHQYKFIIISFKTGSLQSSLKLHTKYIHPRRKPWSQRPR